MKKIYLFLLLLLGFKSFSQKQNSIASVPANLNFETMDFTGWTGKYTYNNCSWIQSTPNAATVFTINFTAADTTSDQHGICTSGYDPLVKTMSLPCVSPFGGGASCRLGDIRDSCGASYLSHTLTVVAPDTQLILHYALILSGLNHTISSSSQFGYTVSDSTGNILHSLYINSVQMNGLIADTTVPDMHFLPWTSNAFSLGNWVGQNVTIDLYTSDCWSGGHLGYAYIDFDLTDTFNGIDAINFPLHFDLYPNPASNILSIQTNSNKGEILITDLYANELIRHPFNTRNPKIDISELPSGIYFATGINKGRKTTQKFIVQH